MLLQGVRAKTRSGHSRGGLGTPWCPGLDSHAVGGRCPPLLNPATPQPPRQRTAVGDQGLQVVPQVARHLQPRAGGVQPRGVVPAGDLPDHAVEVGPQGIAHWEGEALFGWPRALNSYCLERDAGED